MIKNIYFTYCLIPIIIAKNEIVQHEVYIVANIVPDVRPGCLYRSAKAATIGSSLTQGFAVLRAAFIIGSRFYFRCLFLLCFWRKLCRS